MQHSVAPQRWHQMFVVLSGFTVVVLAFAPCLLVNSRCQGILSAAPFLPSQTHCRNWNISYSPFWNLRVARRLFRKHDIATQSVIPHE